MEASKYYTPEMEEFHPGFEFKYLNHNGEWKDCELGKNDIENIELRQYKDDLMKIAHANLRVKFLDREDIESLGWKFSLIKANTNRAFKDLQSNTEKCIGLVLEIRNDKIMIADCRLEFNQILFFGTIKNKSELRKLMQMLQIK